MQLNYRKTIVDQIDEALEKADRTVESVTLTKRERAEFYRVAGTRFKSARVGFGTRGYFLTKSGRWINVLAAGQ